MFERPGTQNAILRLFLDIALTVLALYLSAVMRPLLPFGLPVGASRTEYEPTVYVFVILIWGAAFLLLGIYEVREQRATDEAQGIFVAISLSTLALASALYFPFRQVSRLQFLTFYLLDVVLVIGFRIAVRRILRRLGQPRYARRKVLILGAGNAGKDVVAMVRQHRWAGLEPVGFLDDDLPRGSEVAGCPVLGKIREVNDYIDSGEIEEVIVALPLLAYQGFFQLVAGLQQSPARVRIVPDHFKTTLFRTRVEEFAGVPMITLRQPTLSPFERNLKRAFDLVVGTTALILALPVVALIAAAIKIDSPGRVIYKQQRVGENGKRFWMYKFRTMVPGAEKLRAKMFKVTESGQLVHKHRDDPRVTRVGRLLRATSLDEIPQIINVLKGEMSLVGPRPELPWLVEQHYEPWQRQRFSVPQGITGWWQVNGRSDKPMHLHTEEDLFYIQNYSLFLDVQILWRTVAAVVRSRGAY